MKTNTSNSEPWRERLTEMPRHILGFIPTMLQPLKRLSAELDGPDIWIKRDDNTGLAMGGNKTRKLEFSIGHAIASGADTVITMGAIQSNHARQTAAAALRAGMTCHLVLEDRINSDEVDYRKNGNVFLDRLFGASLEIHEYGADIPACVAMATDRLRKSGRKPYVIPGGASDKHGALGYVECALELMTQFGELDVQFDCLVAATGSGGTHAGLLTGFQLAGVDLPIQGFSVRRNGPDQMAVIADQADATMAHLGTDQTVGAADILVDAGYIGTGYGHPTEASVKAVKLMAESEAILIDPIYTGKALAGMIGMIRDGQFTKSDRVLFLHTGGAPSLFSYRSAFGLEG